MTPHSVTLHIVDIADNDLTINQTFQVDIARKGIQNTRIEQTTVIESITTLKSMH